MADREYAVGGYTYEAKNLGAITANLDRSVLRPFLAVDLLFADPLYYWTGLGNLVLGGVTYVGVGNFLNVSAISETGDIRAANASVSLSGIPSAFLSLALQTKYHGRIARIKFGITLTDEDFMLAETSDFLVQETGGLLSVTPGDGAALTTLFVGYMDQMTIDEGPETSTITMDLESKLVDLERPRVLRYTTESQALRFPNVAYPDLAFEFVNDLQTRPLMWGKGANVR